MRMLALLAVFLALPACNACAPQCSAVGSCVVVNKAPAVPAPDGGDPCSRACAKLDANGCLPASTNADMCASACVTDQAQGVGSMLDPFAVIDAGTVDDLSKATGFHCLGAPTQDQ